LKPHAVLYLRADVEHLVSRVVLGRGAFDFWESGMDLRFGPDMYESFVRYQKKLIQALDTMVEPYEFTVIDASQPVPKIFRELQRQVSRLRLRRMPTARPPARKVRS
jgi:dTMP kinase